MIFTMTGQLDECLLLAYRTPADSVRHLLPTGFELLEINGWAFWNVVVSHIDRMRPLGFPRQAGLSYAHVAYRLYVRIQVASNQWLDGLYFVRSDADNILISYTGNYLTDFKFHPAKITFTQKDSTNRSVIIQNTPDGLGNAHLSWEAQEPPWDAQSSCFGSLEEAKATLKYTPVSLSLTPNGKGLKLAEVFRDETQWKEERLTVTHASWTFFQHLHQDHLTLEMATQVKPIDYRWQLGKRINL